VLWLDPTNPDTFPAGLVDAVVVVETTGQGDARGGGGKERSTTTSTEERLRAQMRADALEPLDDDENLPILRAAADSNEPPSLSLPPERIEEAAQFLRLNVSYVAHSSAPPPLFPFPRISFSGTRLMT